MSRTDNARRGSYAWPRIRSRGIGFSRKFVRPENKRDRAAVRAALRSDAETIPARGRVRSWWW